MRSRGGASAALTLGVHLEDHLRRGEARVGHKSRRGVGGGPEGGRREIGSLAGEPKGRRGAGGPKRHGSRVPRTPGGRGVTHAFR